MQLHLVMLLSDWLIYALFLFAVTFFVIICRKPHWHDPLSRVLKNRMGMVAATILSLYVFVGLADSIHFEVSYPNTAYSVPKMKSILDLMLSTLAEQDEQSYSAPFAMYSYSQSVNLDQGKEIFGYSRLRYGGAHLENDTQRKYDIISSIARGFFIGALFLVILYLPLIWFLSRRYKTKFFPCVRLIFSGKTAIAWREIFITFALLILLIFILSQLILIYHIMGTDKVGHDVFYTSIKSIRTGLLIGTLTTIFMLPFALILGVTAGYIGGWVDDVIQYLYTTLSSIPAVLLISATILVMQVYIATHIEWFPTLAERADVRLLALCAVLGITSWASLCRLLRAETLKLRELEFVQAAKALGSGKIKILFHHVLPNVMHIVLITIVLDFSMLVLAEAVLSYVGVGVDPTTFSWGNMINSSRLELAREPVVWWPLLSALIFMFVLVLSANLFADTVRDALDPRIR